jgi:uncharacterized protein (DUF488 family)
MQTPPRQIWTVGHSTRDAEEFLSLLTENKIGALADVRQFPGSRRFPQFNAENLKASLARVNIEYFHFPELGGRRKALENSPNIAWRNAAFRGYAVTRITWRAKIFKREFCACSNSHAKSGRQLCARKRFGGNVIAV